MDVQKTIEFILEQQANSAVFQARVDERLDQISNRLDRAIRLGVDESRRERKRRRELEEKVDLRFAELAAAQTRTEQVLQAFIQSLQRPTNGH